MHSFNLESGSRLKIYSIIAGNTVSDGNHSYSLNDASLVSIFTDGETYKFDG